MLERRLLLNVLKNTLWNYRERPHAVIENVRIRINQRPGIETPPKLRVDMSGFEVNAIFSQGDYVGAITNARSLVEAVLAAIEKECDPNAPGYDGDLPKLYKRTQKHLNLSPENPKINNSLKQMLTGFISIIGGLSGLSNAMGDRHVREYKLASRHAVLIVNAAMTFSNFVFDTYAYRREGKIV